MMNEGYIFSLWVLAAVLTLTTFTELQSARIPNWVTLPALAFAFIISFVGVGIPLASSLLGFLAGFGFLFIFYMFGGMGGGDVKLMGTVGALLGFPDILNVLMYTAFFGGAMAVIALIWNKRLISGVQNALAMLVSTKKGRTLDDGAAVADITTSPDEHNSESVHHPRLGGSLALPLAIGSPGGRGSRRAGEEEQTQSNAPPVEPVDNPVTIPYGLAIVLGCLMHVVVQTELIPT